MYQSYPTVGQPGPVVPRPDPPAPLLNAVRLMFVGAGLSVISIIISLVTISSQKAAIRTADPGLTQTQLNAALALAIVFIAIIGLIGVGLWIWMAWANHRGKSWARIVASVLFGLDTFFTLIGLVRPHTLTNVLLSAVSWLVGLGAVIFMWNRESSAYYQAISSGQYK